MTDARTPLPLEPLIVRGSAWGLLATYWFAVAAWLVIAGGVIRTNVAFGGLILVVGVIAGAIAAWVAAGVEVRVGAAEVSVKRRFRPTWRVHGEAFDRVDEHVPVRPRAPSMAGWTFHGIDGTHATVEIAQLAPRDRSRLRKALDGRIVDVEARMQRRKYGID